MFNCYKHTIPSGFNKKTNINNDKRYRDKTHIINLIKTGQNLPKEYIYKLFAYEEDVFLFWNGRKEDVMFF